MLLKNFLFSTSRHKFKLSTSLLIRDGFYSQYGTKPPDGKRKKQKQVPLKQVMAKTNKLLYGPLLVTSAERKKRLKPEKENVTLKQEEKILIQSPENQPIVENQNHWPQKLPNQNVSQKMKYSKYIVFHGPPLNSMSYNSVKKLDMLTNTKKLIVTSWSTNLETVINPVQEQVEQLTSVCTMPVSEQVEQTTSVCSMPIGEQLPVEQPTSACTVPTSDDSSLLFVDNSNFAAAPNSFNIDIVKKFPLYNRALLANDHTDRMMPKDKNITTIGIFDDGYWKLPSVRKVLEDTAPLANKLALEKWKEKMTNKLGEEGFEQYRKGE